MIRDSAKPNTTGMMRVTGDDENRVQMTNDERDDANDSQALTGGDIKKYRAFVARTSYLSQDRSDLKLAAMQVCCAMANPSASSLERVCGEVTSKVLVPLAAEW